MKQTTRPLWIGLFLLCCTACDPSDRRPGLWLTGDTAPPPADWSFTDQIPEIAVQVHTPYLLPHSVTIWCSSVDGKLFIGASRPDTKRWPGWVDSNPNVKLKIDGKIYEATLRSLTTPEEMAPVQAAFAAKYALGGAVGGPSDSRLWAVEFGAPG
jgi:hypothetical protein